MNINTMRKIDYWVGIPITFLLTILKKLTRFIFKNKTTAVKNILFIELSEMGSTILADPAMRKAREQLCADLFFVIFKKNKPSLDLLNPIAEDNIFTIRENNLFWFFLDVICFLIWCRRKKIDTIIDLELFSRATAILTGLSGANTRVGFYSFHNEGLYRGNLLTHKVAYNPHIHITKNFIALINSLLTKASEIPYSKTIITDEEIKLKHKPVFSEQQKIMMVNKISKLYKKLDLSKQKIILINPNASELLPQRRWPKQNFVNLIKMIIEHHADALVLITGAPQEKLEAAHLCNEINSEHCINFAGELKLQELPILYAIASLMVTNDSGPAHFASVTDMPTYVIFGPETPALYGALGNFTPIYAGLACSPCVSASNHRKTACHDNVCVQVIKPEFVYTLIKSLIRP